MRFWPRHRRFGRLGGKHDRRDWWQEGRKRGRRPLPELLRSLLAGSRRERGRLPGGGGRGLAMYLLYNPLAPGVDPLGPDNVLTVSAGLLVGTLASASARTHIGAKSPLTGFVGSSNMGGFFAPELRWAGYDHLVIKGRAERPTYRWIHDGQIEMRDAGEAWGARIPETQERIKG